MNGFLRKLFDVRPGEEARATLMFAYSFLVIASLTIVKPVRTSLLLTEQGPETLPYVFMLIALITPLFVAVYFKVSKRVQLNRLIAASTVASIAVFLFIWILLSMEFHAAWFLYAFYVWVTIFGLIATTQFWLLANYVFNAREAKRLFGIIGSGAIAGGILGGYLTSALASTLRTTGMLHFTCGFLVVCLAVQYVIWKHSARANYSERLRRQERQKSLQDDSSPWGTLFQSRLVRYLAAIVGVGVVAGTLIDYQFSVMAAQSISDSDEMTAFFGFWMSNLSVASFVIQILGTGRVLRSWGVNIALMFLPFMVILGAGTVMLFPTLWAASALKVGEGGLKQSLHKAGLELLGLPVPMRLKNRVKALIDVAVDNLATGIAGALILLMLLLNFDGTRELSLVILALAVLWVYLVYRARPDYLNAFRQAIEKRAIRPEDISYEIYSTLRADNLIELLFSKNARQILMALGYLETMGDWRLAQHLVPLAESSSSEVLRAVFRIARTTSSVDLTQQATRHLSSDRREIRIAATRYLLRRSNNKQGATLSFMASTEESVRSAAIVAAAREWSTDNEFRSSVDLRILFEPLCSDIEGDSCSYEMRLAMAEALSIAPQLDHGRCIEVLLSSEEHDVASHAALSAGRSRDERFTDILIQQLEDKHRRKSAREALAEYGESIAEKLSTHLSDARNTFKIRFEIPRVLSMIGTQKCFMLLADNLTLENVKLRYEVIRALNRMRKRDSRLRIKSKKLDPLVWAEIKNYYELVHVLSCIERSAPIGGTPRALSQKDLAHRLMIRALNEKLTNSLERIFRLLGLKHTAQDLYHAYLGISSGAPDQRANAVELLELILKPEMRPTLIPIAEGADHRTLMKIGSSHFSFEFDSVTDGLNAILKGSDDWLRASALYMRWFIDPQADELDCTQFESSESLIIREAAKHVRRGIATGPAS